MNIMPVLQGEQFVIVGQGDVFYIDVGERTCHLS